MCVGGHPDLPTGGHAPEAIARGDAASREDRHLSDASEAGPLHACGRAKSDIAARRRGREKRHFPDAVED